MPTKHSTFSFYPYKSRISSFFQVFTVHCIILLFRLKWPNTTVYRNIYQSTIVFEVCRYLLLSGYSSLGNSSSIKLSFWKNSFQIWWKNLMELEFMELEYHGKLEFFKIEYPKSGRSLHISETVIDWYIFR